MGNLEERGWIGLAIDAQRTGREEAPPGVSVVYGLLEDR